MNIKNAIQTKCLLSFVYDGFQRVVEPHTYGIDTKGHSALRAYQVRGGSESGEYIGWKLFHVDQMHQVTVVTQHFSGPRPKYTRGDKAFRVIHAQL